MKVFLEWKLPKILKCIANYTHSEIQIHSRIIEFVSDQNVLCFICVSYMLKFDYFWYRLGVRSTTILILLNLSKTQAVFLASYSEYRKYRRTLIHFTINFLRIMVICKDNLHYDIRQLVIKFFRLNSSVVINVIHVKNINKLISVFIFRADPKLLWQYFGKYSIN